MSELKIVLKKYWLVIKFIFMFILVYSVLTLGYKFYLDFSDGSKTYPDYFTNLVGRQSQDLLTALDYRTRLEPHPKEPSLKLIVNNKYVARVVEGCNSISIIILFTSFVIAFANGFKKTFVFILGGSALIYAVNLLRIVLLSIGLYHYPWRQEFLHSVMFPFIIYSLVFLLWMFWVNQFAKSKQGIEKSL